VTARLAWLCLAAVLCGSPSAARERKSPTEDRCWSKAKELFGDTERSAVETELHSHPPKVLKSANPSLPEHIKVPRPSCLSLLHEALVSPSGDVVAVWSARSNPADACPEFEEPAVSAIQKWKYSPLLLGKRPVPFCVMVSTTIDVY
jgi:hypothetical protein